MALDGPPVGRAGLARDVAVARRVGRRLNLIDLEGRVSARTSDGDRVLMTPAPSPRGDRPSARDLVEIPIHADPAPGTTLPRGWDLDGAVYRSRPDVGAIAVGSPVTAMAFGSVGRDVLPLTHTWAEFAHQGAAWLDPDDVSGGAPDAAWIGVRLERAGYVHVPGVEVLALGDSPLDALRRLDALEYLARLTMIACELDPTPDRVTAEQAAAIPAQRPPEPRPSRDYRRYYRSLDRPARTGRGGPVSDDPVTAARIEVATACRILAAGGDLVAFFEHVSRRIPGRDDLFAMSPATDFARMRPEDVGIVAMDGDCRPIGGPFQPAPFRWYHRDILRARPDVGAIVHTHELHGRAYVLARDEPPPIHRSAVHGLATARLPVFTTPSLLFDPAHRAAMIELLGDGPIVHAFAHGTDICAPDIASATVAAVQREEHLRFTSLARRLGTPHVLGARTRANLAASLAPAEAWWAYLAGSW